MPQVLRKGDPLSVYVELDKAPVGSVVEIGIDRAKSGDFTQVKRFSGAREQRVGFKVGGGNGGLLFQTAVHDWVYNPDTRGVSGERPIRVRMFKKDGEKMYEKIVPVAFDDTPPQGVQFLSVGGVNATSADEDTPVKVKRARKLAVRAAGEDPESKIKQVVFFWGKPKRGKDGMQLPPTEDEAVRGQLDDEGKNYVASLDLAADRKCGEISVYFVNGVGLSVFKTIPVEIDDTGVPPPEKKGGTIRGVVVFNNLKQPGTTVTVTDAGQEGDIDHDGRPGPLHLHEPGPRQLHRRLRQEGRPANQGRDQGRGRRGGRRQGRDDRADGCRERDRRAFALGAGLLTPPHGRPKVSCMG